MLLKQIYSIAGHGATNKNLLK